MAATTTDRTDASVTAGRTGGARLPRWLALLLVSLAGLLLEVGYTRIVGYKLWYYYTYLVIGLSLLGIGSGAILVAIWEPMRRWATERIIAVCSVVGAVSIALGYLAIARLPIDTLAIWDYGSGASFGNLGLLALICLLLFASFIALGVILATVLGRAGDGVGRLYFADLVGAALGCLLAIPLIVRLGPPAVVMVAALVFAAVGVLSSPLRSPTFVVGSVAAALLLAVVAGRGILPDVRNEAGKFGGGGPGVDYSDWGPVFRVDVTGPLPAHKGENRMLIHDGNPGSGLWPFNGDLSSLTRYDSDPRAIPFAVLDGAPGRELIIGSAGGNEILASLYFGADDIEAVELNPVTVSLLKDHFADYTGHLTERPDVKQHQGDGRSYLARHNADYDLVWFPAPDSYAANNAASLGAFVLSESYLYTTEMIEESLDHLTQDGIMVVQFGEWDFGTQPSRTSRYITTARRALTNFGVDDPASHLMVAVEEPPRGDGLSTSLSTIVVKRTPFTDAEADAFATTVAGLPDHHAVYAPGVDLVANEPGDRTVARLAGGSDADVQALVAGSSREIDPISDDAPFFWHFHDFPHVLGDILSPLDTNDPEDVIGERVLLLLLAIAVVYAAVFLLLPFVAVRRTWRALPAKGPSGVYFAALGLGFMFFEITMIQRLVLFLGYPTYSLTVTLASILVFTGIGALASRPLAAWRRSPLPLILGVLACLTVFYRFGLDPLTESLLSSSLGVRVLVAVLLLAPLGLCLGMFMPLGLATVSRLTDHGDAYAAWGWAINGFFSVIGSVLTTILSMSLGFRAVQLAALAIYAVAVLAFVALRRSADRAAIPRARELSPPADEPTEAVLAPASVSGSHT
ncbi:MAG TPA: hypothetical protein VKD21_02630 [Acidimicrobiales bacterium]|nr:hypothetical protein [Acidimicrobiales bacterium]